MLTKEQQEMVDFTRNKFAEHPLEVRTKMYMALLIFAAMKWPEAHKDFAEAFMEGARTGWTP